MPSYTVSYVFWPRRPRHHQAKMLSEEDESEESAGRGGWWSRQRTRPSPTQTASSANTECRLATMGPFTNDVTSFLAFSNLPPPRLVNFRHL